LLDAKGGVNTGDLTITRDRCQDARNWGGAKRRFNGAGGVKKKKKEWAGIYEDKLKQADKFSQDRFVDWWGKCGRVLLAVVWGGGFGGGWVNNKCDLAVQRQEKCRGRSHEV